MGFLIIALIFFVIVMIISILAERKRIRCGKRLVALLIFLGIAMLVAFALCPSTAYKEAELIYEIHLNEKNIEAIENVGVEMSEVDLDKIVRLMSDNTINHVDFTNLKLVNSDLVSEGIIIQIYKTSPERSFWKPSGPVVYDCVILW